MLRDAALGAAPPREAAVIYVTASLLLTLARARLLSPAVRLGGFAMALVLRRTALFLFIVVIWAFVAAMVVHASASHAPKSSFPPARAPIPR